MDKRKRRLLCMLEGSGRKSRWISGAPPLSFKAFAAGTLENYRIYGNTVGGESVGDRTGNLFDWELADSNVNNTGAIVTLAGFIVSIAPVKSGVSYTISRNTTTNVYAFYDELPTNGSIAYDETRVVFNSETVTFTAPITGYIAVRSVDADPKLMINSGSTPLPYEPYGYKVPVTVSNGTDTLTTPIYLPEQIRKVGDDAEYIDYGEQKMHRIGVDDIDVTLPALPTMTGTNVLSVGTAVQPSRMEVKGRIKAVGQETEPEQEAAEAEPETAEPEQE